MRGIIGIGLFGVVLLSGCVFWGDTYHKKEVTSFVLDARDNPGLSQSIPGKIDQTARTIVLRFPNTVAMQSFVPRFQYSGLQTTLDGTTFESGSRAVDFSKAHTLEITGVDDTVQTYAVQPSYQAKVFRSFVFPTFASSVYLDPSYNYGWNDGWATESGFFENFTTPTKSIQVTLPNNGPTSLVPTFVHNAVQVQWNGQPLISGATALDATADQMLILIGIDGSTQNVELKFTYQPLALTSFQLLVADNPTLRKDYAGTINEGTKVVSIAVPNYVDAATLVARFTHNGTKLLIDGLEVPSETPIDLSESRTLTLSGVGNRNQDYQLLVVPVPAAASKQILSRGLYGSVSRSPPFLPTYSDKISSLSESSPATDVYTLSTYNSYYNKSIDTSLVYLEIQTTAIQVSVGGQTLAQGLLASGVYSPANWMNFASPVVLTLTAEDLTTKTVTLNLVVK